MCAFDVMFNVAPLWILILSKLNSFLLSVKSKVTEESLENASLERYGKSVITPSKFPFMYNSRSEFSFGLNLYPLELLK